MADASFSKEELVYIKSEIKMARKLNEDVVLPQMREAIERYTGQYIPEIGVNWDVCLNEIYPIIQYNLPSIFFKNPRVFLKPRQQTYIAKKRNPLTGDMEEMTMDSSKSAKTQEAILNYAMQEIRFKQETRKVLMDALLFKYGVMWHGYKGNFGMTDEQSLYIKDGNVFVKRLNPMRFFKDPACGLSNLDEARWIGRSFDVPIEDLVEDKRLNVDKKKLKGRPGYGDLVSTGQYVKGGNSQGGDVLLPRQSPLLEFADERYRISDRAKFVEVFEIFIRPNMKERNDGEKGKVILFTYEQEEALRTSKWPYKAEGWPGIVLEFNPLLDAQFPLADIDTYKDIADQKNAIVNIQLRNAQENSKVWVGISKEGANEEDIETIKQGENTIVLFEGANPRDKMFVASPGGQASSELYLIDQRIDKNLQDKSGVTDLKRGFIHSGEESATSVQIRAAGGSARPAYRQDIMADFLRDSTHFLNQLIKQFYPYDKAVRIVGSLDIEWSANPTEEEVQADTDVEIDVISMLPENPEKEIQELQTVLALMVQGLSDPVVAQKLAKEGKTIQLSPVIENLLMRLKIKNPDIFRNIKPEESEGFVSVAEIRAAKANVEAALAGSPEMPSPPRPGQDHIARLETYSSILNIIQELGDNDATRALQQLVQIHQALLEEEQRQNSAPGTKLKKPTFSVGGA